MRREDALLNEGAKIVLMREDDVHYIRLAARKDGILTMLTRKMPLSYSDYVGLYNAPSWRATIGELDVRVEDRRVIAELSGVVRWGSRYHLTEALERLAR